MRRTPQHSVGSAISRIPLRLTIVIALSFAITGCDGLLSNAADPRRSVSPEDLPETKRIQRLTADQFFASLTVATGQQWDGEAKFAATLGRPDFGEVTTEGREMSVGFAKLANDAARQTCRAAVTLDRATEEQTSRVILRHIETVDQLDPFDPNIPENLRYLVLRFHGIYITDDSDSRIQLWLNLLQNGLSATDEARFDAGEDRWIAVCTGLAIHPDFVTY